MAASRFLDMYIGFGCCHSNMQQPHWMLVLAAQGSTNCTFYHSKRDSPTTYQHIIEAGQSLNDPRLKVLDHIGVIYPTDQRVFYDMTRIVPPQRCHTYVVAVLEQLEIHGLIYEGSAGYYQEQVPDSVMEQSTGGLDIDDYEAIAQLLDLQAYNDEMGWGDLYFDTCYY
ncbi:hypothetical protein BJX70DRAFT_401027 [Aspergillus crustosus]